MGALVPGPPADRGNDPDRDDPDRDVVALVAQHDMTGALRCLMRRHGTSVYRYCREALRDAVLAEDVQQQVFLAAFLALPKFGGRSSVRTWLFAIARNRVLDAAKSRKRAQKHVEHEAAEELADPRPLAGDSLDDERLRSALIECIGKLQPHVQSAVLLRYQQSFTYEEMAEVCDEKPGTLQAQVMRAMPVLRNCIETTTGGKL
jgi:RNA polymerase sigma-70 factor, ECF subfamily